MLLAVVGLGALGLPMAVNLHNAGYALQVHTRSRKAEQDPGLSGSRACATPAEAVAGCSALLLCVSDDDAVEAVLWSERGAGHALTEGSVVIDCSTISPAQAKAMAARLKRKGIHYIDAPVTGGTEGAKAGSLTVLVGGHSEPLARVRPVTGASM